MMLIKCVLVLLFVNFVCSSVLLRGENEKVKRVLRGAYKYNHPPSAEYSSVPVPVVYEDKKSEEKFIKRDVSEEDESDEVSQESVEDASDEESSEEVSKEVSKEDNKEEMETNEKSDAINPIALKFVQKVTGSSKEELIKDTAKEPDTIESHLKQVAKMFVPQKEMFIPVKVIYDVEPENLRKPDPSTQKPEAKENPKPITRLQRNNHIEKESEVKGVKSKSTPFEKESEVKEVKSKSKPKKTPSDVNIKTGTFPKRTEEKDPIVPIVQSENYVFSHSGDFHYSYEGGDGTKAFERGELSSDKGGESVEGSFSYIGKDGKDYSLTYTADENGYRPVGAHLPTPPPIPVAIARALKYLATKPTPETVTEQA